MSGFIPELVNEIKLCKLKGIFLCALRRTIIIFLFVIENYFMLNGYCNAQFCNGANCSATLSNFFYFGVMIEMFFLEMQQIQTILF